MPETSGLSFGSSPSEAGRATQGNPSDDGNERVKPEGGRPAGPPPAPVTPAPSTATSPAPASTPTQLDGVALGASTVPTPRAGAARSSARETPRERSGDLVASEPSALPTSSDAPPPAPPPAPFARLVHSEASPWSPLLPPAPGTEPPPAEELPEETLSWEPGSPADPDRPVRVELSDGLEVEVRGRHGTVHVTVHGTADQLRPLRDLAPELRAELASDGVALGTYTTDDQARDRQPDAPPDPDPASAIRRKPASGHGSAWRSGRRTGRYA